MQVDYLGKQYTAVGIAKSTVLPEEFILLQGHGEYLVAPTHDLSGLNWQDGKGVSSEKVDVMIE